MPAGCKGLEQRSADVREHQTAGRTEDAEHGRFDPELPNDVDGAWRRWRGGSAISRRRLSARSSDMIATLTHAMSRTEAAAAISSPSGSSIWPNRRLAQRLGADAPARVASDSAGGTPAAARAPRAADRGGRRLR